MFHYKFENTKHKIYLSDYFRTLSFKIRKYFAYSTLINFRKTEKAIITSPSTIIKGQLGGGKKPTIFKTLHRSGVLKAFQRLTHSRGSTTLSIQNK